MGVALTKTAVDVPDVVLERHRTPRMSGIEGIRRLRQQHPDLLMLVLTVYEDDDGIFEAVCAGACGYLLKKAHLVRLMESIREAHEGSAPLPLEVAPRAIRLTREILAVERADYGITPHELRLLKLLAEGHRYRTAAAKLGVSAHTVSFHLRNIYEKLQVHSKSEAVGKALRQGLIK